MPTLEGVELNRALISITFSTKLQSDAETHDSNCHVAMLSAPETLNREFLEIRCKILELAAAFDRLDRTEGSVSHDPRLAKLHEALKTLLEQTSDRAEQVQMIFSRDYDKDWQAKLKPTAR
jgi:hypothetical protein